MESPPSNHGAFEAESLRPAQLKMLQTIQQQPIENKDPIYHVLLCSGIDLGNNWKKNWKSNVMFQTTTNMFNISVALLEAKIWHFHRLDLDDSDGIYP